MANEKAKTWLQENWDKVAHDHPEKWVAATQDGIVATGDKSCCVMQDIIKKGLKPKDIEIMFVPKP